MQYFPVSSTATAVDFTQPFVPAPEKVLGSDDFGTVLSSFIEEGRTDYTGLPPGFSAHVQESGTLDRDTTDKFKQAMRERGVDEASLDLLDQLAASGMPATVGRIFSVLSGNTRISAPLEGEDRMNFTQLMGKLGFSKEETEELLGMTDDGKTAGAWKRIAAKIKDLGSDGIEMHKSELSALLRGLDMSEATQAKIATTFGGKDSLTLGREHLELLLGEAAQKIADREAAQKGAQVAMRDAMSQVLQQKKVQENSGPVEDMRGSRRTDQSEALMQESLRKKTGDIFSKPEDTAADGKLSLAAEQARRRDAHDAQQDAHSDPRDRRDHKDGQSRAERILATSDDKKSDRAQGKNGSGSETALDRMMQRIDVAAVTNTTVQPSGQQVPAQDLNSMARSFRQEIFSQVENGILQNMQNGNRQLTLQLNPENLGQLTVILSVNQGELRAVIRADNQDSATVLSEQMAELKATLESQGIKVKELEVQTQLQDNSQADQWNGTRGHNELYDAQERARMTRISQMRREAGNDVGSAVLNGHHESAEQTGLHIVA